MQCEKNHAKQKFLQDCGVTFEATTYGCHSEASDTDLDPEHVRAGLDMLYTR